MNYNFELNQEEKQTLKQLRSEHIKAPSILSDIDRWNVPRLLNRDDDESIEISFNEMLPLWVGSLALDKVSNARRDLYIEAIEKNLDFPMIKTVLNELEEEYSGLPEWAISSVYSLALLNTLIGQIKDRDVYHIMEIGGGYGLLASYSRRFLPYSIKYTLIDAIPESLMYSYSFLKNIFHDDVHLLRESLKDPSFKANDIDIIPSWQFEKSDVKADIVVNISSIQEMPDDTAKAYLEKINACLVNGGGLVFANSRDFLYARKYNFPDNYKRLMMRHTPRSRTLDFPIELFEKTQNNYAVENQKLELEYYWNVKLRAQEDLIRLKLDIKETRLRLNKRIFEITKQRDKLRGFTTKVIK